MLLHELVATSEHVRAASGRREKVARLSACIRRLAPDEIEAGVNYLAGRLPQGGIGIGPAVLKTSFPAPSLETAMLSLGDADQTFHDIARSTGSGSAEHRRRLLGHLLSKATESEQRFLVRLVLGELRQGALEGLMVEAVAAAAGVASSEIRRALMLSGDLAAVARTMLSDGRPGLGQFALNLLQPIHPMLAQPAADVDDALQKLGGTAAFEHKMDGARIQVHKLGEDVRIFTRALNDVTSSVPEIVETVRALPSRAIVLDGEALAFRPDGIPHPFQITMRRIGRKLDVAEVVRSMPLNAVFFDCLHLDGRDVIDLPAEHRIAALHAALPPALVTPRMVTRDVHAAEMFLQEALARGHEGVMAKALDAPYEAGRRGKVWLKVKRAHTLDLVVLAAEWGHGRRQGTLSNLHLGARDPAHGGFVMLGKTFKGMTDEMLRWQTAKLQELEIARDAATVYVRPELVVEIAFNDLQVSPHYPAGLALRFARVKRYRPDKSPEQADTIDGVRALAVRQAEMQHRV
jgi:DNA ligase-1